MARTSGVNLSATYALITSDKNKAFSGGTAPLSLTFKPVRRMRTVDPWPVDAKQFMFLDEDFIAELIPSGTGLNSAQFKEIPESGSTAGTTKIVNSNFVMTASGGAAYNTHFAAHARLRVPHVVLSARLVSSSGTIFPNIGFVKDNQNKIEWFLNGTTITFRKVVAGAATNSNFVVGTLTAPYRLGILLAYPWAMAMIDRGNGWEQLSTDGTAQGVLNLATTSTGGGWDFTDETELALWYPTFGGQCNTAAVMTWSEFKMGVAGGLGVRDPKVVTYTDGTPYIRDGKYFFSFTVASGGPDFKSNHLAVASIDPQSYEVKLEAHLFFRYSGHLYPFYPGHVMFDPTNDVWTVVVSQWGDIGGFSDNRQLQLFQAFSERDLTRGLHILDANLLTVPTTTSIYDAACRWDGTNWWVAVAETDIVGSAAVFYPSLYKGPTLNTLVRIGRDTSNQGEGTQWAKINGSWYVLDLLLGSPSGSGVYDTTMTLLGTAAWLTNANMDGIGEFSVGNGPGPHPCVLAVNDYSTTRYLLISFDKSTLMGYAASTGALVVCEADQKPTGWEHPRRRLVRGG